MKKFIRLHNTDDNKVALLPVSSIIFVGIEEDDNDSSKSVTNVYLKSDIISAITVNENPEKVLQVIIESGDKSANFIKLHENEDNSVCIVNADEILLIDVDENGKTELIYNDNLLDDPIIVNETPERVFNMLEA